MKHKKRIGIILVVIILLYTLFGFFFFRKNMDENQGNQHLENVKGQEIGLKMHNMEEKAKKDVKAIENLKKEGSLDEAAFLSQIETSKKYLQDNLNMVNPETSSYYELLYHSAFYIELGECYELDDNDLICLGKKYIHILWMCWIKDVMKHQKKN